METNITPPDFGNGRKGFLELYEWQLSAMASNFAASFITYILHSHVVAGKDATANIGVRPEATTIAVRIV